MEGGIGQKLENFYLSLVSSNNNYSPLVESLRDLEEHQVEPDKGETNEVVNEIVKDCRKKGAQLIRSHYAELNRNVISMCRKKLTVKASLDNESSQQHGQRHLNALVDLLGTWSNIVSSILEHDLSCEMVQLVLTPLYSRLIEVAFECFTRFKQDKELEQWSMRLLDEHSETNLEALDFLIAQVSSMREFVHQHYLFLHRSFQMLPFSSNAHDEKLTAPPRNRKDELVQGMLIVTQEEILSWRELEAIYVSLEFGFISQSLFKAYQEIDLIETEDNCFIPQSLEDVFFLFSKVSERAFSTGSESCIFSIGNKITELINNQEDNSFQKAAILFQLVTNKKTFINCFKTKSISRKTLFKLLKKPSTSLKSPRLLPPTHHLNQKEVGTPDARSKILFESGQKPPQNGTNLIKTLSKSSLSQMILGENSENTTVEGSPFGTGLLSSSLTDVASASLTGVNQWLSDFASPYIPRDEDSPSHPSKQQPTPENNQGQGLHRPPVPTRNSGIATSDENINRLTSYSNPENKRGQSPALPPFSTPKAKTSANLDHKVGLGTPIVGRNAYEDYGVFTNEEEEEEGFNIMGGIQPNPLPDTITEVEDWMVQINSLAVVVKMVQTLKEGFQVAGNNPQFGAKTEGRVENGQQNPTSGQHHSSNGQSGIKKGEKKGKEGDSCASSTIAIVVQEFSSCERIYFNFLSQECVHFASQLYQELIKPEIEEFSICEFNISGDEMESRYSDFHLLRIVGECFGTNDFSADLSGKKNSNTSGKANHSMSNLQSLSSNTKLATLDNIHGHFFDNCEARLSQFAYSVVLSEIKKILSDDIINNLILTKGFSEWGALLLHQEVLTVTRYLDDLIHDLEHNLKLLKNHQSLQWAVKILTLDAPGDIRKYNIPVNTLDEKTIRQVLSRRIDFSKDAVNKVKINIIS